MIKEKNYEALKRYRPALYEKIKNTPKTGKYEIVTSAHPKNYPNLKNTRTGMLYYDNRDPVSTTQKKIRDKNIVVPNLAVFLGMGLMYNVMAYKHLFNKKGMALIIIEKDPEVLAVIMESVDIEHIIADPEAYFLIDMGFEEMHTIFYKILMKGTNKFHCKALQVIEEAGAFAVDKEYYLQSLKTLTSATREVVLFFGNDPQDSLIGIEHTFLNINKIIDNPGVKDLQGAFKGRPGIVVATGPSLDKNINLLKGLEDKAVICAADASMAPMQHHGLKPHLVTSLERVEATSRLFESIEDETFKDVFFAACPVIHPKTYENYKGETIVTYRDFATFKWLDIEKGIINTGPSAGNMAFNLLVHMGCDPIILIGQDLAYGEGEATHAEGSTYGKVNTHVRKNTPEIINIPGNYTETVQTNKTWLSFLKYYENDIYNAGRTVINATEGGAKIHGTQLMTFKDAVDKYIKDCDQTNVSETVRSLLNYPGEEKKTMDRAKTKAKVDEALAYCRRITDNFRDMTALCTDLIENHLIPAKNGGEYTEEADRMYHKLNKAQELFFEKDFYHILMHYVQSYYIRTIIEVTGVLEAEKNMIKARLMVTGMFKEMYEVMIVLVERMIYLFEVMKQILENAEKQEQTETAHTPGS